MFSRTVIGDMLSTFSPSLVVERCTFDKNMPSGEPPELENVSRGRYGSHPSHTTETERKQWRLLPYSLDMVL